MIFDDCRLSCSPSAPPRNMMNAAWPKTIVGVQGWGEVLKCPENGALTSRNLTTFLARHAGRQECFDDQATLIGTDAT